ncbi:ABC transporter substrate-binding protein, partial [Candidatus Pelagibacter sp.]|nr:ABC transporter substrate-binding protein [Candidatus Pelagibacter sp.]MDC3157794.1 ABC transporter substrate-binding protein [Candidatus Pelagibacter sp.]
MKTLIKLLLFLLLSFSLFNQNIFASEKIRIGLIVPLSGDNSLIGEKIIKSIRMAINKINDNRIEIIPKDTKSNPIDALRVSKELYKEGVKIVIGPVFNESTKYLDDLKDITFISFTNKLIDNPKNVISAGVNAISQLQTIKKFNDKNNLSKSIFLIPKSQFKKEIEEAISKTEIKHKKIFYYDREPTKLTKQIEDLTKYQVRKNNLKNEIKRIEGLSFKDKESRVQNLKKKDTLGNINFDSVIIADFDENLKSVATSLLYTDVSSKRISYITLNQWFDESLLNENSLHPLYFPSINKVNYEIFMNDFKNVY